MHPAGHAFRVGVQQSSPPKPARHTHCCASVPCRGKYRSPVATVGAPSFSRPTHRQLPWPQHPFGHAGDGGAFSAHVGPDQPGIIKDITKQLYAKEASITHSKMM